MQIWRVMTALVLIAVCGRAAAQGLAVGDLLHDGPATPEQISLLIPVTGTLAQNALATVRYRRIGSSTWSEGHPLYRIQPQYSNSPAIGEVTDDFAWPVLGLTPGTSYEVEVTVSSGNESVVRAATFTTRSLPPAAGAPNKTISSGATGSEVQFAFDNLQPGDVLELANGTYNVDNLELRRSGTASNPIYVRGETRSGVVLVDPEDTILRLFDASHVVIENITLQGSGSDGGQTLWSVGILSAGNSGQTVRNTIRNVSINGVDQGITFFDSASQALVYNNSLAGNNQWNSAFLSDSRTWDDDGINLPGIGNVAFNNTISNFGDSFAYAQHSGSIGLNETRGVHFYRNEIRNSLDDLVETDYAQRNITFYDNRSHNSSTCTSLDPLYGGPFVYVRNICINSARSTMHKWNDANSGQFLYNNTFIATATVAGFNPDTAAWYQPNNGAQRSYGFRNNVVVYGGNGDLLLLDSGGHDPIDWTHNSWFPDTRIQWGGVYPSLASARQNLPGTEPVFSGSSRRMQSDNITTANPWTLNIVLGADSFTEVTERYTPALAAGSSPRNSGVAIPNITDGFSGSEPDRGAIISGRPVPAWGDQDTQPLPDVRPNPPADLEANPG